jgi:hypothetical protein
MSQELQGEYWLEDISPEEREALLCVVGELEDQAPGLKDLIGVEIYRRVDSMAKKILGWAGFDTSLLD